MRKKKQRYIRGEREERFKRKIKGIKNEKVLGVSIDISKDYHKALIFDFEGKIINHPFEFDVFQAGYDHFEQRVEEVTKQREARNVFFTLEPTGL